MSDDKFVSFLEEEIERTHKGTQTTYLFGIIIAVLVGGYMAFILFMVQTMLEPQNLALLIRNQVEIAGPQIIREAEASLTAQATDIAEGISDDFMRLVPRIGEAGREQIDMAYEEYLPVLSDEFAAIIKDYVDQNADELKAFASDHNSKDFAEYFTLAMMQELTIRLDERLQDSYDGRGIKYFDENVLISLMAIDETVTGLAEADLSELDRRERLQRKILARLVTSVIDEDDGQ